jgi:Ca-activated chloride channel family protein
MFPRRQLALALLLVFALAAPFGGALVPRAGAQQQQQPPAPRQTPTPQGETVDEDEVLTVDTSLTNVIFSAVDRNKRFVSDLSKEDIRVLEDGVPQEIFTFQKQVDLPLTLALVIDTSGSQEHTLPDEKRAARSFVDSVMRPTRDEVAVVSFTGEVTLEVGLTGNPARVRQAIERVEFVPPSGWIGGGVVVGTPPVSGDNQSRAASTSMWDAVWITCDEVLSESSERTRRAIILLTDGYDTSSQKKLADAVERAIKTETIVFAIGIGDRFNYAGVDEGTLKKLTERTGGRAYFPRGEDELQSAFAQIQRELREQYLVAYSPTNKRRDGTFRKLQIELASPERRKELKLTYRQGYFAKSGEPGQPKRRRS